MPEIPTIFDRQLDFDPAGDFDAFARQAPARWAVYLMSDAQDWPVQLLCVKNLRNSLKRRLGEGEMEAGPSRRVNYREMVRRIRWRRVDSAFEADWIYYEAARLVFPETYRGMIGFRPAWFIHVNPQADFPRYTKMVDLTATDGELIGPVEDKHAAARLMHLIEDAFDLCRYHHILIQSPNASACAYKEMAKCPAPCDGSVSLDQYRRLVELSVKTLIEPAEAVRQQAARMQSAAAELRFETAAKIKAYIDQLSQLGKGAFRHVGRLREFSYLCFQHGPSTVRKTSPSTALRTGPPIVLGTSPRPDRGDVKVFLITAGHIEEILGLIDEPTRPAEILRAALELAERHAAMRVDQTGAERIGVVAHHLFSPKQTQGIFLRMDRIDEKSIAKAWRDLRKQTAPPEESEGEGVVKELQAM